MAAQLSAYDDLVLQLRAHITAVQAIADLAYASASGPVSVGTRRDMERVGNCAADLAIALGSLKSD